MVTILLEISKLLLYVLFMELSTSVLSCLRIRVYLLRTKCCFSIETQEIFHANQIVYLTTEENGLLKDVINKLKGSESTACTYFAKSG
jgi:hypothetical protein